MKKSVKYFFKFFILSFLITFASFSFSLKDSPRPIKKIKIFFETFASTPVLWESVELIKSPANELKIFFFHRYPNQKKRLDLKKMNAIEVPLTAAEGFWPYSAPPFIRTVKKILAKYPDNIPIEVYSNLNQAQSFLLPFLFEIDSKRIERLHLYEDGACNVLGAHYNAYKNIQPVDEIIKNIIQTKGHPTIGDYFGLKTALSKLVPATYHLCQANIIKKDPALKNFVEYIGPQNIVDTDLIKERNRLTGRERKMLARFFNIDMDIFKHTPFFQKTLVVTVGYIFGNKNLLKSMIANLMPLKSLNARIFLKCHPSYSAHLECEQLKKAFPEWETINAQTPLEVLFLIGKEPDYIGGYGSSLYFLIPPKKILFLLGGFSHLLRLNIINDYQITIPSYF